MNLNYCGLLRVTAGRLSKVTLDDFPHWGKVGEDWGKTLEIVLRVSPCFPHFSPQRKGSQDQICATLLIKIEVYDAYEASPTGESGGRWGKRSTMI